MAGRLYLLPCWIDEEAPVEDTIPAGTLARIRALRDFVVEDARSARRFLAACAHPVPMREIAMTELNGHTSANEIAALLEAARQGRDLGLLSEAGAPAVADPGARLVAAAHAESIVVVPLVGPSSILLALMAAGLEGQRFRFAGYLPVDAAGRREALGRLEQRSAEEGETQVFIETPYRNQAMLAAVLERCAGTTQLSVSASLSGPTESIRTATIEQWRRSPGVIGKRPAIFLLLAGKRAQP